MRKLLAIGLFLCLCPIFGYSQSVIRQSVGAIGTSYSSDQFDVQSIAAQPYNAVSDNTSTFLPGFIQPLSEAKILGHVVLLKIYPNPTSAILHFSLEEELSEAEVRVYDLLGNVVHQHWLDQISSGSVDCSEWTSGLYTIQIMQADQILCHEKFVKY